MGALSTVLLKTAGVYDSEQTCSRQWEVVGFFFSSN